MKKVITLTKQKSVDLKRIKLSFSYKNDSEICGQKHTFNRRISSDNIAISAP